MSVQPGTKVKVNVPKAQITYMAKNSIYTYQQMVQLIQLILEDVLTDTKKDLVIWIKSKVPKRTGQLRKDLIEWLDGSTISKGILRVVMGTYLPYAEDVAQMSQAQVRHSGEIGYVYYPNKMGIRGRVILDDPRAVGYFWDKLMTFAKDRAAINLIRAKNKHLGQAVKRAQAGAFAVV